MAGLNNLFRKKKRVEEIQKKVPEKKDVKKKSRERRYCLLVEEAFETSRMQGVMVRGTIHGRIRVGDTMYLYQVNQPVKAAHVLAIEPNPRESVETAKDTLVVLCLDLNQAEEISRFAVLSNQRPIEGELANRLIENPRLFGLMMAYRQMYTNSAYMDALLYELCQARFVLPLYMEQPPVPGPDGTLAFDNNTFVGFRPLKMKGDDTQTVFPAFTDEIALMGWKDAFQEGQPRQLATMGLPILINYVEKGHAGLVVNPFGPVPVYFPKELLEKVAESEPYKERYIKTEPIEN